MSGYPIAFFVMHLRERPCRKLAYYWRIHGQDQIVNLMLRWTITFLVIALIAAVFGFTGIAAGAAEIAKIIFYIFLAFLVISLIAGAFRRTD